MNLEIKDISKSFGKKDVLNDVSFTLELGEITALVGRNGSGKTTLLKIISQIYDQDKGAIVLDNKLVQVFPEEKVNLAYLPDRFAYFDYDSIAGAMAYYKIIYPDFDENFANKELAQGGFDKKISLRSLSKGNKSMVGLILILATGAKFILVDEVLDGMDVLNQEKIIRYLLEAAGDGRSILVSSHELTQLQAIADKVVYLNMDGSAKDLGDIQESGIIKIQIVSKDSLAKDIEDRLVIRQKIGRVYTAIGQGSKAAWEEILKDESVVQYDFLPVKLEDYFYYEKGREVL